MSEEYYRQETKQDFIIRIQELAPPGIRRIMDYEAEFLRRRVQPGSHALDIGCGAGRILQVLQRSEAFAVGIDIVWQYLVHSAARCREGRPIAVLQADTFALPFRPAAFDLITIMINTLGNFGDRQVELLQGLRSYLKPAGRILLGGYSTEADAIQREWYGILHQAGLMAPIDETRSDRFHLYTQDGYASERYTVERLAAICTQAGFSLTINQPDETYLLGEVKPVG